MSLQHSDFDKSRYETDSAFAQRQLSLATRINSLPQLGYHGQVIFRRTLDRMAADSLGTYDASRGVLTATLTDLYSYFFAGRGLAGTSSTVERAGKGYVGQNAFGARQRVFRTVARTYGVVWSVDESAAARAANDAVTVQFPVSAKGVREIEFLGAAKLTSPYILYSWSGSNPTLDAPYDRTEITRDLQIETPCLAIRNKVTHEIYSIVALPSHR